MLYEIYIYQDIYQVYGNHYLPSLLTHHLLEPHIGK